MSILTTGQIVPLSAAQISQLIMPGASAVGGAQQILNVGGQNILVSGSGPGTVGNVSLRYGKILKGVHKYFCNNCKRPFTQKESLTRHQQENCLSLGEEGKKKYQCEQCQSRFSSKQYLREHVYEIHLKQFLYFCKSCGKGYYKHCGLVHHKKSCLAYLTPGLVSHPVVNPSTDTTTMTMTTTTTTTTATTASTMSTDTTTSTTSDPLIGGGENFQFADPMFLPNLAEDDH